MSLPVAVAGDGDPEEDYPFDLDDESSSADMFHDENGDSVKLDLYEHPDDKWIW